MEDELMMPGVSKIGTTGLASKIDDSSGGKVWIKNPDALDRANVY